MTVLKALYFPVQGEQGVSRFAIEYDHNSLVAISVRATLGAYPYTTPLAYFKLKDFLRDPIPSLGQRLSDALPDILENRIELDDRVSHMWPNGSDRTYPVKMDILIMPEEVVTSLMFRASLPADLRSRHPGFAARQTLTKTMGTLPRPSMCSSDPKQLFEHAGTLAGRPFGRCGPPASIFDSHLAGLADALLDLTLAVPVPSSSKVAWALKFFIAALGFHDNEPEMEEIVRPLVVELFDYSEWYESIEGGRELTHGAGWIYELKTQKGLGGDPEAQSIADYEKLLADKMTMYGKIRDRSRLPTILISQAGPQLDIAVVVYAQTVLVDQLFTINLRDGIDVDKQVLTLARLATCLTNTHADLNNKYSYDLHYVTAPVSPLVASVLHLPSPASATPPHSLLSDDLGLKFLYKLSQITGEPLNLNDETDQRVNTRHAVFVALGGGIGGIPPEKVVVKFTKRYNTAAHTKLAALGLAPKLYYHAAVRGGLFMVVMEKVVGSTAFRWLSLNGTTRLPLSVYTDVEAAVKELHEVDLVFGDLRLPNIMIRAGKRDDNGNGNGGKAQGGDVDTIPPNGQGSANTGSRSKADSDSGVRALLIDFDWVAKDGVGRYPATISTSQEFSPAVDPYGLMHKAHDLYCLDLLQKRCK